VIAVLFSLPGCGEGVEPPPAPSVRLVAGPGAALAEARFEVVGLPERALESLRKTGAHTLLRIAPAAPADAAGLEGAYDVADGVLRFTPERPLEPGLAYRAVLDLGGLAAFGVSGRVEVDFAPLPEPEPVGGGIDAAPGS
jgi:hypothetical protein